MSVRPGALAVALALSLAAVALAPHTPNITHTTTTCPPSPGYGLTLAHLLSLWLLGVVLLTYFGLARAHEHVLCASYWSPPRGAQSSAPGTHSFTHKPIDIKLALHSRRLASTDSHSALPSPPSYSNIAPAHAPALSSVPVPIAQPSPSSSPSSGVPREAALPPGLNPPHAAHGSSIPPAPPVPVPAPVALEAPVGPIPLPMPARRDRIAPVFDSARPRDLPKFFADLEFLLVRASVVDDQQKKYHATRYLELIDQELWEFLPEFRDPAASFAHFASAVFALYPEADLDRRYSAAGLEALVAAFAASKRPSRTDFCVFYRDFWRASSFLRSKHRLASFEQSQALVRAIPPTLRPAVDQELELRFPDVHVDDTYPLEAVRAAIDRVLLQNKSSSSSAVESESGSLITGNMPRTTVPRSPSDPPASRLDSPPSPPRFRSNCSYCSDPTHWIRDCPRLTFDLASGFCKRNAEGKVVLPNGRFVPHSIVGPDLRSRIELCRPMTPPPFAAPVAASAPSTSRVEPTKRPIELPSVLLPLTDVQRMAEIESELAVLRAHRSKLQRVHAIDIPAPSPSLLLPNQRQHIERSFLIPPRIPQESFALESRRL